MGDVDLIAPFSQPAPQQNGQQLGYVHRMEALGQVTGGIAHELNNMLLAINLNIEALAEEVPASLSTQPLFDGAQQAIEQTRQLIRQLLAFSRRQPLAAGDFDVNRAVIETRILLRLVLPANIDIETVLSPKTGLVFADRSQFEMALLNLVLNAGDAMPNGGKLTIETSPIRPEPDAGGSAARDYVVIAISDTGPGMAPTVAARAFEPFFTTRSDSGHSGLGLSQVYGYAQQSGGRAEINCGAGGTTVRMLLPCRGDPAPARHPQPTAPRGNRGETILMVEDAPLVRLAVSRMLADLGYEVLTATSPEEALAFIESDGRIDLLFTDIVLPGALRGDELAVVARRLRPDIRVLCTSGYSEMRLLDLAQYEDQFGLIAKPYSKPDLAFQLRRALDVKAVSA